MMINFEQMADGSNDNVAVTIVQFEIVNENTR